MVGAEVTELIQGYVVAMNLETTEEELMHTVFPHPTLLGDDARERAGCVWAGDPQLRGKPLMACNSPECEDRDRAGYPAQFLYCRKSSIQPSGLCEGSFPSNAG